MARFQRKVNVTVPRIIALILLGLVIAIQHPLWKGKGSYENLAELRQQLTEQKQLNADLEARLARLQAEAVSLREGDEALESRARSRLNMIKENELLIRLGP